MPPLADEELSLFKFIRVILHSKRSLWAPYLCSRAAREIAYSDE